MLFTFNLTDIYFLALDDSVSIESIKSHIWQHIYEIRVIKSQAETCGKCQHRVDGNISALNSRTFDRKYRKCLKYTTP